MKKKMKYVFIGIGILIAVAIIYQIVRLFLPDIQLYLKVQGASEKTRILNSVRSHGVATGILLIFLVAIFTAIPGFPISAIAIFIGVCYGRLTGSFMNIIGCSLGNILSIYLIRDFKLDNKSKKSGHWIETLSKSKHPDISLTIAYMIPFIPSVLINYTTNQLNLTFKQFIWIVIIGAIPSSVLYAYGGDALFKGNFKAIIILIVFILILVGVFWIINKKRQPKT